MISLLPLHVAVSLTLAACQPVQDQYYESSEGYGTHSVQGCSDCGELPSCSVCSSGTGSCPMPQCGVCGSNLCWDCSHDEGIDLESLTPKAQSKKLYEASMARIMFLLPEDAGVSLLDQRMATPGPKRSFVVSVNDQSKDYKYEIKVDVVRNGKKYFRKLKIQDLRAGMILFVGVEAPPVPEGEPAEIAMASEVLAPGGKPPEAEEEQNAPTPDLLVPATTAYEASVR